MTPSSLWRSAKSPGGYGVKTFSKDFNSSDGSAKLETTENTSKIEEKRQKLVDFLTL